MLKSMDISENAIWKQRFWASVIYRTQVASQNPGRGIAVAKLEQSDPALYAWDVATGELRVLTRTLGLFGLVSCLISPDGSSVYFLKDEKGNELGHVCRLDYETGEIEDVTPTLRPFTLRGMAFSPAGNQLALNPVNEDGYQVYYIGKNGDDELHQPQLVYETKVETWGAQQSYAGELVALKSAARAEGMRRYSTLVIETTTGHLVGELWDGDVNSVEPIAFCPVESDFRLLATTTEGGYRRPVIWNPMTNQRVDANIGDLHGEVLPLCWSPDGRYVICNHFSRAIQQLYRYDTLTDSMRRLDHPAGAFGMLGGMFGSPVYYGPNGQLWASYQNASEPMHLVELDAETGELIRTVLSAGEVPPGRAWQSITYPSSDGTEVQAWLSTPEGDGPFPTIMDVHGGPHAVTTETFSASVQMWLDHGFAFLSVNYRGSTTFGREFQQKIWGNIGHWELEDMVAGVEWLVEEGVSRPGQIILTGASYGGYLTLWGLSRRPDLWAGGIAYVAIADWIINYEDASDALKGAFTAWFGGNTPEDAPELYRQSSPITYLEDLKAPLYIIQGHNDSRTTARQMEIYEAQAKELGKDIEVIWFDAGHGGQNLADTLHEIEETLKFAYRILETQ